MEYDELSNNGNLSDALYYSKPDKLSIIVYVLCSYSWLYVIDFIL